MDYINYLFMSEQARLIEECGWKFDASHPNRDYSVLVLSASRKDEVALMSVDMKPYDDDMPFRVWRKLDILLKAVEERSIQYNRYEVLEKETPNEIIEDIPAIAPAVIYLPSARR